MSDTYILAYGSLINFESAARTLQRELKQEDITPVTVSGYTRTWNYKALIHSAELDKNVDAAYLNLTADDNKYVNGIVFKISDEELERLKAREKNYDMVDVTDKITPATSHRVFAFICFKEEYLAKNGSDAVVMKKYIGIVESGCAKQGADFHKEYLATTETVPFEIVEGDYTFI